MAVQWVHLGADELLVASKRGRVGAAAGARHARAQRRDARLAARHLCRPRATCSTGRSRPAERATPRAARGAGRLTPPRARAGPGTWSASGIALTTALRCCPSAIEPLRAAGRSDLAEFARRKLEEEQGHDQFSLADLRALGYDAQTSDPDGGAGAGGGGRTGVCARLRPRRAPGRVPGLRLRARATRAQTL